MSYFEKLYKEKFALLTDLYQLTMGYGYWKNQMHEKEAVFHLFFRKHPFGGNYTIASGLEQVVHFLNNFKFTVDDIQYLARLKGGDNRPLFDEAYLNYLQRMEFSLDISAVPEGTLVHPHQPLLRIKGPLLQAQLIETALLTMVNFSTLIATKSARIVQAAQGDSVLEFGLRRAQGIDGGLTASRSAYVGGCHATSNVLAGKLFHIPVKGTHAHSWIMCFDEEIEAFEAYARAMPNNCVFLVDTYDTIEGVKKAIQIGQALKIKGYKMNGIRLDSGDLCQLSIDARQLLDEAGFEDAAIIASNDLDEYNVKLLKEKGAKITVWGIGTRLATAYDQPALGGVYKLAAIKNDGEWDYKVKLSEQIIKVSNPGILSIKRYFNNNIPQGDMIYNTIESSTHQMKAFSDQNINFENCEAEELMVSVFENGKCVYQLPHIEDIRNRTLEQLAMFDNIDLKTYPNGLEANLYQAKTKLIQRLKK